MICTAPLKLLTIVFMRFFFIFLFLFPVTCFSDQITLHFIKAPTPTRWDSPRSLTLSALRNQVAKVPGGSRHSIGHAFVELQCGNSPVVYSGVTSTGNSEERRAIFLEGYGMGVVFKNYRGKFDSQDFIKKDLDAMFETGRSNFVRFEISNTTCERLTEYLSEYERLGYHKIYAGLNARPLLRQSAGCSAYGMSFLELAGLQATEFEENWRTYRIVPRKWVGGPLTGKRVKILKILTAIPSRWDQDLTRGGFPVDFWDPEKMHLWTKLAARDLMAGANRKFPWPASLIRIGKSSGVLFDATSVPTPEGPFFQDP
jgi:hypothetical protein